MNGRLRSAARGTCHQRPTMSRTIKSMLSNAQLAASPRNRRAAFFFSEGGTLSVDTDNMIDAAGDRGLGFTIFTILPGAIGNMFLPVQGPSGCLPTLAKDTPHAAPPRFSLRPGCR